MHVHMLRVCRSKQDTTASMLLLSRLYLSITTACSLQQKVHNKDSRKLMAVMQLHTSSHSTPPGQACLQSTSEHMLPERVFSKIKLSKPTLARSTSCSCCLLACQWPPSWGEQRPWASLQPLPWSCTCQAPGPVHKPLHFRKTNMLKKKKRKKKIDRAPCPADKPEVDIFLQSTSSTRFTRLRQNTTPDSCICVHVCMLWLQ